MRDFYLVLKAKVEAGQYILSDMVGDIQDFYAKGRITVEQMEELILLAEEKADPNFIGNKYPRPYDLDQDVRISDHDNSIVELFEMVLISSTQTQITKMATLMPEARSISNSYVRLIIAGTRTFSSVPDVMKEEVADKLIAQRRCDLIDVEAYHPPHGDCVHGNNAVTLPL
ncbi:MAG: CD1375 family protein [Sarcina sp.]